MAHRLKTASNQLEICKATLGLIGTLEALSTFFRGASTGVCSAGVRGRKWSASSLLGDSVVRSRTGCQQFLAEGVPFLRPSSQQT